MSILTYWNVVLSNGTDEDYANSQSNLVENLDGQTQYVYDPDTGNLVVTSSRYDGYEGDVGNFGNQLSDSVVNAVIATLTQTSATQYVISYGQ